MFSDIVSTIYNYISSVSLPVPMYPSDYSGHKTAAPFILFTIVLPDTKEIDYSRNKELRGLIVFSIYYPKGQGQLYPSTTSTTLDSMFQNKRLSSRLSTRNSSLHYLGLDTSDTSLSRADYSVVFNYYGV